MYSAFVLIFALVAPQVLEVWRGEIEAAGGVPVLVVEVEFDSEGQQMPLAEGVAGRALFAHYLRQDEFVRQFVHMRGVMVHHRGWGGEAFLVMLNGARRAEWESHVAALVGHEFGHAWLRAKRYPVITPEAGDPPCLGIHAGDIVEHVLIRRELDRREIGHRGYAVESYAAALAAMRKREDGEGLRQSSQDRCLALRQVALWVDARLGLGAEDWPDFAQYEAEARRVFPGLEEHVGVIEALVRAAALDDPEEAKAALEAVAGRLRKVGAGNEAGNGFKAGPYVNLMRDTSVALSWLARARRAWPVPSREAESQVRSIP
jgi:hypothetical protein